ncbi:MAG: hypothetical protein IKB99_11765 [Lentisphaeria bacterium]|nr:hypothetical protein [Lentisphaeria bacterium]
MYLGVKAVAALAIERIHRANLVNFGIIPMIFDDAADYDAIEENDALFFAAIREQIKAGNSLTAELRKADGSIKTIKFTALLSEADKLTILAGGTLNQ